MFDKEIIIDSLQKIKAMLRRKGFRSGYPQRFPVLSRGNDAPRCYLHEPNSAGRNREGAGQTDRWTVAS